MLGDLSGKYESGGNPACVSQESNHSGDWRYGIFQFSSASGVVQHFVQWLQRRPAPYCEYANQLAQAGDRAQEQGFVKKWLEISSADPVGFGKEQNDYAKLMYFDRGADHLLANYYFDILQCSEALQQVLFANCVQHGSFYGAEVFREAADLAGQYLCSMTERDIIHYIYEVKLTDVSWSSGKSVDRQQLLRRWQDERNDALIMLQKAP